MNRRAILNYLLYFEKNFIVYNIVYINCIITYYKNFKFLIKLKINSKIYYNFKHSFKNNNYTLFILYSFMTIYK